jgi:Nitrogen regulatory protein P-II
MTLVPATPLFLLPREHYVMSELQTIRRVTVYADGVLESILVEQAMKLGSKGYTVMNCRGKGKHEILDDPLTGVSSVRIEFLVRPEVADKIMQYIDLPQFRLRAVAASMETVQVPASEEF